MVCLLFMRKARFFSFFLALSFFAFASTARAGAGVEGTGIVRLEPCADSNLLVNESLNNTSWPYRVAKPDHCIHIYPEGDALHKFYYTLPKDARIKTGYYKADVSLGILDSLKDGDRIHFVFGVTGGGEGSMTGLITDEVKPAIEILEKVVPLTEEEKIKALDLKEVLYPVRKGFDGLTANNQLEYGPERFYEEGTVQSVGQQLFGRTLSLTFRQYPTLEVKKYKDVAFAQTAFRRREQQADNVIFLKLSGIGEEAICRTQRNLYEGKTLYGNVCAFLYRNVVVRQPFSFHVDEPLDREDMKKKMLTFAKTQLVQIERRLYTLINKSTDDQAIEIIGEGYEEEKYVEKQAPPFKPGEVRVRVLEDAPVIKPVQFAIPGANNPPGLLDYQKIQDNPGTPGIVVNPSPPPAFLGQGGQGSAAPALQPTPVITEVSATPVAEPVRSAPLPEAVVGKATPAPPLSVVVPPATPAPMSVPVEDSAIENQPMAAPVVAPAVVIPEALPTASVSPVPILIESGPAISAYYKAKLEKTTAVQGTEKQIEVLKTLRDEIDGMIAKLIKNRSELTVSELSTLVTEVKVSQGEIKADNIAVKTTGNKLLINVGNTSVSIEPTEKQVLIRDGDLEVHTDEAVIRGSTLSVGGVDVKMSASEVVKKLGLMPKTTELKEENAKAVYSMKIEERRKLFGFISLTMQKTVEADAENGVIVRERRSWYSFLTTK